MPNLILNAQINFRIRLLEAAARAASTQAAAIMGEAEILPYTAVPAEDFNARCYIVIPIGTKWDHRHA